MNLSSEEKEAQWTPPFAAVIEAWLVEPDLAPPPIVFVPHAWTSFTFPWTNAQHSLDDLHSQQLTLYIQQLHKNLQDWTARQTSSSTSGSILPGVDAVIDLFAGLRESIQSMVHFELQEKHNRNTGTFASKAARQSTVAVQASSVAVVAKSSSLPPKVPLHRVMEQCVVTLEALHALRKMAAAVESLPSLAQIQDFQGYEAASNVVKTSAAALIEYAHVPVLIELMAHVAWSAQTKLEKQLFRAFRNYFARLPGMQQQQQHQLAQLKAGCALLEGIEIRRIPELIKWFLQIQIIPYRLHLNRVRVNTFQAFLPCLQECLGLMQQQMTAYDSEFQDVFPRHWYVDAQLLQLCYQGTRSLFNQLLKQLEQTFLQQRNDFFVRLRGTNVKTTTTTISPLVGTPNVSVRSVTVDNVCPTFDVYEMLIRTKRFESSIRRRWRMDITDTELLQPFDKSSLLVAYAAASSASSSSSAISHGASPRSASSVVVVAAPSAEDRCVPFQDFLSCAFAPYVTYMFEKTRIPFFALLQAIDVEANWAVSSATPDACFVNATTLLILIQKTSQHLGLVWPTSQKDLLAKEFLAQIVHFVRLLSKHAPSSSEKSWTSDQETFVCVTITTVDQLLTQASNLVASVGIDPTSDEGLVLLDEMNHESNSTLFSALTDLSKHMAGMWEPVFLKEMRIEWKKTPTAAGPTLYVRTLRRLLVHQLCSKQGMARFSSVCQWTMRLFYERLYAELQRLPVKWSEEHAQRLLLDMEEIKEIWTTVVSGETTEGEGGAGKSARREGPPLKSFLKAMALSAAPCESMGKILLHANARLIGACRLIQTPTDSTDATVWNMLRLRGLSTEEQTTLVNQYNAQGATKSDHGFRPVVLKEKTSWLDQVAKFAENRITSPSH